MAHEDEQKPHGRRTHSSSSGSPASHDGTSPATLRALRGGCLGGHGADLFECELEKLSRHGRALDIVVRPHLLGNTIALLRVYDAVVIIFRPQVSLEAQDGKRDDALGPECRADL